MSEATQDILIDRIIDGDGADADWRQLELLAARDPQVWREFAEAQRARAALARAMTPVMRVADRVELPRNFDRQAVPRRIGAWSGWAVAATVVLVVLIRQQLSNVPGPSTPDSVKPTASIVPSLTEDDAFQAYLDKGMESGRVIGEVPTKVLVESRPSSTGDGYELLYLRQVLERAVVPDLYRLDGRDELGQPMFTRYEQPTRGGAM